MTGGSQRSALDAINSARPFVARLGSESDKEDLAADIIEAWSAVEMGLRSLLGGSALSGQTLIRELRQRQFLSLDQANALAEFHAACERAGRTDYTPTDGDINATRSAYLKLEAGLMAAPGDRVETPLRAAPAEAPAVIMSGPVSGTSSSQPDLRAYRRVNRPSWFIPAIVVAVLLIAGLGGWYLVAGNGSGGAAYDQGVVAYREGRREAAQGDFRKAALDKPADPMPHVFLARMEREQGNLNNANAEAVKAVQLGPMNLAALRELGSVLFAEQNFDGARTFYVRAIKADSSDRTSQGYLGCSLIRLGRVPEGQHWLERAGTGAWSACAPQGAAPGQVP